MPALARLLYDAAALPLSAASEHRAVASFHQARIEVPRKTGRVNIMKSAFVAAISTKIFAGAAVAVAASGGIALAASQGVLTATNGAGPHTSSQIPAVAPTSDAPTVTPSPTPSMRGLCVAFRAGAAAHGGRGADNPAFKALVTAAGGSANVATFCASQVPSPGQPSSHASGAPTSLPAPATNHPTGAPTSLPGPATNHPTGAPTAVPGRP